VYGQVDQTTATASGVYYMGDVRSMIGRLTLSASAVLLLATCAGPAAPSATSSQITSAPSAAGSPASVTPSPTVTSPLGSKEALLLPAPSTEPYPGLPWYKDGQRVPAGTLTLLAGPAHCGWQNLTLLTMGWPLGTYPATDIHARQYVRDPGNEHSDKLLDKFIPSVDLPPDAEFTGYRNGTDELWTSPRTIDTVVYMVRPGKVVEQWPRARDLFGCA
jgi:hypothetical protein